MGTFTPGRRNVSGGLTVDGTAVFNEASADKDFRIESDGNANMLVVNAGTNRVGIGTATPGSHLEIKADHPKLTFQTTESGGDAQIAFKTNSGATLFNIRCDVTGDALNQFALYATGDEDDLCIDANGTVGIGIKVPAAQLHIDQASTTGAIPVLSLDQADISDGFINFIGTSAGSAAGPISTWTTATLGGFVRVEINGVQKWMPFYGDPSS